MTNKARVVIVVSIIVLSATINRLASAESYHRPIGFAAAEHYYAGENPFSVISSDLDLDGDQDLVVANSGKPCISVLFNLGNGNFSPQIQYITGNNPSSVVASDFNGDGFKDLAAANWGPLGNGNSVSVLINNRDGTFAEKIDYTVGVGPHSIAAGDFDKDGDQDIVVANSGPCTIYDCFPDSTISVLMNQGDGSFDNRVDYTVGPYPLAVVTADLDADGDLDLAVANYNSDRVSVLKNQGNGTFATKEEYLSVNYGSSLAAADLDGDGYLDLAVAHSITGLVSVLLNLGNGTFANRVTYPSRSCYSIFPADFDNDGDFDLATAAGAISVLENKGNGVFAPGFYFSGGTAPISVIAPDVDGDGDSDIVVANYNNYDKEGHHTVSVLKNVGEFFFGDREVYNAGSNPFYAIAIDLDGDKDKDLAVVNFSGNSLSVLKNDGYGKFSSHVEYPVGTHPASVASGDLDQDGDQDLVITNWGENGTGNTISVLMNNGNGGFVEKTEYVTGVGPRSVDISDLDADGDEDIVIANSGSDSVAILKNQGNGSFAVSNKYGIVPYLNSVHLSDLDADGDDDLISGNYRGGGDGVTIWFNSGEGTFGNRKDLFIGNSVYNVLTLDADADGDQDIAVANSYNYAAVSIFYNGGDGSFSFFPQLEIRTAETPFVLAAADFNGDGYEDIAGAKGNTGTLSILANKTDGTFATRHDYGVGTSCQSVFASDVNGDGDNDLVVADYEGNSVSILTNISCPSVPNNIKIHKIEQKHIKEGENLSFKVATFTPCLRIPTLSVLNPPSYSSFSDSGNGVGSFRFTPHYNQSGTYYVTFVACNSAICDSEVVEITVSCSETKRGDLDGNFVLTLQDIIYLVYYIFKGGPGPVLEKCDGDANNDNQVGLIDIIYLANYIFKDGPPPQPATCCL